MRINEIEQINEDSLYEMSNFHSNTTGLPKNIVLWVKTDSNEYGHSKYRVKIKKNKKWSAIYTVGQNPDRVKNIDDKLSGFEQSEIKQFIKNYSTLIINLIDEKIDSADFGFEIKKHRGQINEEASQEINWTFPDSNTLQADFTEYKKKEQRKWEGRANQLGMRFPIFDDLQHFIQSLKNAEVRTLDDATDRQIHNRSHTDSIEGLKRLVGSYYQPRDVDRIIQGYTNGAAMPYPIVIEGNNGAWIMAGNTRLDTAGILGLQKKVLWVDVRK